MANFGGFKIGNSDIRRVQGGQRVGGSHRQGWGLETVTMGTTLTVPEARRRIRMLSDSLKDQATGILLGASHVLVDKWKEYIDAEGYGPSGGGGEIGIRPESLERLDEETSGSSNKSTGRYYNSIRAEVDQDLEVHIGSDIPRPSGRGLEEASYPELLEFGTSQFEGMYILTHALEDATPIMEEESVRVFNILLNRTLMQGKGM